MKKYLLKLKLTLAFLYLLLTQTNGQANLQIVFHSAFTTLANEDSIFMFAGIGILNPSDHWGYTTGELAQPGSGLGKMTPMGPSTWGICLEPFSYFSQGTAGPVPNGSTIYNLDMLFHNPGGTIMVTQNTSGANIYFTMSGTSTPVSNFPGTVDGVFQSCTLGIDDIQITNGVITNYPNPLVDKTQFLYSLKSSGKVSLKIYNAIGQIVKTILSDEHQTPNTYSYKWTGDNDSGRKLFNGVYYYTLSVNSKVVQTNKLIISR
jgi:hypothetical protein